MRINIEHELQNQISKVEEQCKELDGLKERNIELYKLKEKFEEEAFNNKSMSIQRGAIDQIYTDEEHIKEMLGT